MRRALQRVLWWTGWLAPVGVTAASLWYGYWNMPGGSFAPLAGLRQWLVPMSVAYVILLVLGIYAGLRRQARIERGEGG